MDMVEDEAALLGAKVPLAGTRLLELGCGKAEFSRRVAGMGPQSVVALEVDRTQHRENLAGPQVPGLTFGYGAAEEIPFDDASFDGVMMMKSLHHVPVERLDRALSEVRRVLKPGGWAYISEPVYGGPLNDIIKLFHDEGEVRAAAQQALRRAVEAGVLELREEMRFDMPARYRDYDQFVERHVQVTHSTTHYPPEVAAKVRELLARHMGPEGARFAKPMHVYLLRRPD